MLYEVITVMPDRIEAGTFMVAAAITGGDIHIRDMRLEHLDALVFKLQDAGVEITNRDNIVRVRGPRRIAPVNIKTRPYPGFPTDMQAQFMTLMCLADGASVISENIFENRFMHVAELRITSYNVCYTKLLRCLPTKTKHPHLSVVQIFKELAVQPAKKRNYHSHSTLRQPPGKPQLRLPEAPQSTAQRGRARNNFV